MSVEDHVNRLTGDLAELRGVVKGVDGKVDDLRTGMARLTEAMTQVVKLEVKHDQVSMSTAALRDRQDLLERRLDIVEKELPSLLETRGWVIRALAIIVGGVVLSVLGLVLTKNG